MYKKINKGWIKHLDFIIIDAFCLQIAFIISYIFRQKVNGPYMDPLYRNMMLFLLMIQFTVTFFLESFKNVLKRGIYQEFVESIKHCLLVILVTSFFFFLTQTGEQYSRIILLLTGLLYFVLTYFSRLLWKRHLKLLGISGKGKRSLLVVTYFEIASAVLENVISNNYGDYQVSGIVVIDKDMTGQMIDGIPVVSSESKLLDYVCREWVDQVFINLPPGVFLPKNVMTGFNEMGIAVHQKLIDIAITNTQKCRIERLGGYAVLTSSINMASSRQLFLKRVMDISGGLLGCIITIFLFLIFAPMIFIKSPGPVLFSQYRVGKNGKKFKIYKFRSMYMDAEKRKAELLCQNRMKDGMMFKLDNDPRIIGGEHGLGGFMRKFSIDEWPQMWNVLKGEMSLVGTRPPTLDEWEKYELHHRARLSIKPGLTGLWQISGRSSITDFEEVVKLDKQYITEWCFKKDVEILLKTIGVVVYRVGAL
ncbi:sugar transferase [Clostridium boliviensis]|uniref:Sugar transferase n=1 Tax=Clostridium boliviensis TaxID=318465 RepID=A0ABU4GQ59_9CLOT|nr:sugar transferase [Clostridium boliviensis]MDW2799772.1 sugar transferase [Clostridium boliviensis]